MIQVDVSQAVKALKYNFPLSTEAQRNIAISRAINRSINMGKTSADREIRKVFNMKKADIMGKLKVSKSYPSKLTAKVNADYKPLSIARFVVNAGGLSSPDPDVLVEVEIRKGFIKTLPRGNFWRRNPNGLNPLVFFRGKYSGNTQVQSKQRYPMQVTRTASVGGAGVNDQVQQAMSKRIEEVFPRRVEQELAYLMR